LVRQNAKIASRPEIGCCMIAEARIWPRDQWIKQPRDWHPRTVVGATYDLTQSEGRRVWLEAQTRLAKLPVLDTAHIRPFADGGAHDVDNGIALRVDLHGLFDRGYVTFDQQRRLVG
jgi:putative restriction endonuclease